MFFYAIAVSAYHPVYFALRTQGSIPIDDFAAITLATALMFVPVGALPIGISAAIVRVYIVDRFDQPWLPRLLIAAQFAGLTAVAGLLSLYVGLLSFYLLAFPAGFAALALAAGGCTGAALWCAVSTSWRHLGVALAAGFVACILLFLLIQITPWLAPRYAYACYGQRGQIIATHTSLKGVTVGDPILAVHERLPARVSADARDGGWGMPGIRRGTDCGSRVRWRNGVITELWRSPRCPLL